MVKLNETEKSVRAMYAYMASVTWVLNHYPEITDKLEELLKMIEELKDAKVRLGKEDDEENKSERQFGEKYFTRTRPRIKRVLFEKFVNEKLTAI